MMQNIQIKQTYLVKFDCKFANRNEYVEMKRPPSSPIFKYVNS